jgi:hypothetical protein
LRRDEPLVSLIHLVFNVAFLYSGRQQIEWLAGSADEKVLATGTVRPPERFEAGVRSRIQCDILIVEQILLRRFSAQSDGQFDA